MHIKMYGLNVQVSQEHIYNMGAFKCIIMCRLLVIILGACMYYFVASTCTYMRNSDMLIHAYMLWMAKLSLWMGTCPGMP